MTPGTLALIILAAILIQIANVVFLGLYRRRRQFRDLGKGSHESENGLFSEDRVYLILHGKALKSLLLNARSQRTRIKLSAPSI